MSKKSIRVTPIKGESLCYLVESKQGGDNHYRVELLARQGNGECSCHDFRITCLKNIHTFIAGCGNMRIVPYCGRSGLLKTRTQCVHIDAARKFCLNQILKAYSLQHPDYNEPTL